MPESSSSHIERRAPMKSPPYPRNIRVAGILKPKSPSNRSSRLYQDEILYTGDESRSSSSDYQDYYPLTPPSRPFESNRPYIPCPP
jgi:hypothetical protein